MYMTIKRVKTNSWACFVQYVPMQYMLILRLVKNNSQILTSEALLRFDFCGGLIFGERKRRKERKMEVNWQSLISKSRSISLLTLAVTEFQYQGFWDNVEK